MASPNPETDSSSMFMHKNAQGERVTSAKSPLRTQVQSQNQSRRSSTVKNSPAEITIKDFFDFMKTAYQVYEHLEGGEDSEVSKIDWEELTKLTVINHVLEQQERDLLKQTAFAEHKPIISKSDSALEHAGISDGRRASLYRRRSLRRGESRVEMHEVWTEANLKSKLNDVINEGILDSILPYIVGYKKPTKTTSSHQPIIKKTPSATASVDIKKPASFGGLVDERPSRDRLGRRKSSLATDKSNQKQEGDVEIHVCDEVKGLKKDFRCPQKLLVSKMGYFADVTAGQKLEDMDISVHCDIQIFDWLMRWVKRDTILVADWPLLDPSNVIPILVSASFLQMDPLLHDCLIYCHAHMNEIVKTSTNLACLSDTLLTRLAAMYTNTELEAVKDRKDKIHSRLFCKMILSLAEPVLETLRGHYATLATLFKCSKCNKLLGRNIAEKVPCQPSSMRIDQRGNVLSAHTKDPSWNLNEYIVWLHGELRSWRRVYWRLWGDCHFLKCIVCDSYFPTYQMEWCCHHAEPAQFFSLEARSPLPLGRYPCCGERAYRFELITRNTGCQFREHTPDESSPRDAAVMAIYNQFRDTVAMRPPQLMFPERLTRLVAREPGEDTGRLQGKEVFWWEGIQLAPIRQPLGLLGKLYTGNTKFNLTSPLASNALLRSHATASETAGTAPTTAVNSTHNSLAGNCSSTTTCACAASSPEHRNMGVLRMSGARNAAITTVIQDTEPLQPPQERVRPKKGVASVAERDEESTSSGTESSDSSEASESSSSEPVSEEDAPPARRPLVKQPRPALKRNNTANKRRIRGGGRQWVTSQSARSNQDGQRRFEERALRQMKLALARRGPAGAPAPPPQHRQHRPPPGGVYVKLEAEWREIHCPQQQPLSRQRNLFSAKQLRKVYK